MDQILAKALESFLTGGIPGAILVFILLKIGPTVYAFRDSVVASIERLEEAQDRSTKADLLRLVANPLISDGLKEAARGLIQEIDHAALERCDRSQVKSP